MVAEIARLGAEASAGGDAGTSEEGAFRRNAVHLAGCGAAAVPAMSPAVLQQPPPPPPPLAAAVADALADLMITSVYQSIATRPSCARYPASSCPLWRRSAWPPSRHRA